MWMRVCLRARVLQRTEERRGGGDVGRTQERVGRVELEERALVIGAAARACTVRACGCDFACVLVCVSVSVPARAFVCAR
jgi:hypothetical protein